MGILGDIDLGVPAGKHYLPRELALLCYDAGWSEVKHLLVAVSICLAEGNGYEQARHVNPDGSIDRGLWQINNVSHPDVTDAVAYDAVAATKVARDLYVKGGFGVWSSYLSGAYKGPRAMGYAFDAVANFLRLQYGFPIPS